MIEKGSLRWAIEQANTKPSEASEILIQAVGKHRMQSRSIAHFLKLKHLSKSSVHNGQKQVSLSQLMVQIILKAKVLKPVRVQRRAVWNQCAYHDFTGYRFT
jgi:hypothetical protein